VPVQEPQYGCAAAAAALPLDPLRSVRLLDPRILTCIPGGVCRICNFTGGLLDYTPSDLNECIQPPGIHSKICSNAYETNVICRIPLTRLNLIETRHKGVTGTSVTDSRVPKLKPAYGTPSFTSFPNHHQIVISEGPVS
jgi:hypothetical protein